MRALQLNLLRRRNLHCVNADRRVAPQLAARRSIHHVHLVRYQATRVRVQADLQYVGTSSGI